jgi:ABC-type transporter lipoprotein component MlaA
MNKIIIVLIVALLSGCAQPSSQPRQSYRDAVDSLNKQIEDFNATRDGNMGITPIDKRVSRVVHNPQLNQVATFDQNDKPFIILNREPDGRFKGILEQPYHQLAFSGPDGSHSWGHILAEFYLEKGMF